MFDIKEDVDVEPQCITALMEQLDVFISIKPKPKQPSKVQQQAAWKLSEGISEARGWRDWGGEDQRRGERLRVSSRQTGWISRWIKLELQSFFKISSQLFFFSTFFTKMIQ